MDFQSLNLDLDDVIETANEKGEGLWDVSVDVRDCGDHAEIWLIDRDEFITSENFMDGFCHDEAVKPIEQAIIEQTGDEDFYFDAYSYAGEFVGSIWFG